MKIGIDARFLTHPQRGGFKTYTRTLLSAVSLVDHENEYIIYTDRQGPIDPLPENFTVKPVSGPNAILREQFTLPRAMVLDGVHIAHYPCNTAPILGGPRLVTTIHDAIPLQNARKHANKLGVKQQMLHAYWRSVIPRAAARSALIVTVSEYAGRDIRSILGISERKLRVVHNAVSDVFSLQEKAAPPQEVEGDTRFILAFASADGRKNHPSSLAAYSLVREDFPDVKLVIVCASPELRECITRSGGEGIIPVGPVDTTELAWLYRSGLALLFPSLDEGFGLPPLEAMSCGMPVVSSRAGSLPEVLGDKAIFVDPTNIQDISDGLRQVLDNLDLRRRMAVEGPKHASQFTLERMGRNMVSIYEEAMALK